MKRLVLALAASLAMLGAASARAHEPPEEEIAELELELAIASDPSPQLILTRARLRREMMQVSAAVDDCQLAIDAGEPDAYVLRAELLMQAGEAGAARTDLDAYVALTGGSYRALWLRGVLRADAGDIDGAVADLDAALAHHPGVDVMVERGRVLLAADRPARAAEGLRCALDLTGAEPVRVLLFDAELASGDPRAAAAVASDGLAQVRVGTRWLLRRVRAHDAAGDAEAAATDRADALAEALRAFDLRPSCTNQLDLAAARVAVGDVETARADIVAAAARCPDDSAIARIARMTGGGR